jgi:hypothetical protein
LHAQQQADWAITSENGQKIPITEGMILHTCRAL